MSQRMKSLSILYCISLLTVESETQRNLKHTRHSIESANSSEEFFRQSNQSSVKVHFHPARRRRQGSARIKFVSLQYEGKKKMFESNQISINNDLLYIFEVKNGSAHATGECKGKLCEKVQRIYFFFFIRVSATSPLTLCWGSRRWSAPNVDG